MEIVVSESYIYKGQLVVDFQIEKIFDKPVVKFKGGLYQV